VVTDAWQHISASFVHKIAILRQEFLGQYGNEYAWALFIFSVLMILVSATFSQMTVPWALLVFAGLLSGVRFPHKALNRLWLSLLGMHLIILLVFAIVKLFLAARYPLALSVTALLVVPFALERALVAIRWHQLKTPVQISVVLLLLWGIGECVSGLDNVTRARAIKDSGVWLAGHTNTPGSLVSNDWRIAYYAGRYTDNDFIVEDVGKVLPGLRKVSVTPWCDIRKLTETCREDIIWSRKPIPLKLCGETFVLDDLRSHLQETLDIGKDYFIEFVYRDTNPLTGDMTDRVTQTCDMIRELTGHPEGSRG